MTFLTPFSSCVVENDCVLRTNCETCAATAPIEADNYIVWIQDTLEFDTKVSELNNSGYATTFCGCSKQLLLVNFDRNTLTPDQVPAPPEDDLDMDKDKVTPNLKIVLDTVLAEKDESNNDINASIYSPSDVVVAVIDAGFVIEHPALKNNVWKNEAELGVSPIFNSNDENDPRQCFADDLYGFDFVHPEGFESRTINDHGTEVAKLIVSKARKAKLMDLRIFNEKGEGSLFDALCAMDYAIGKKVDIINMSWGYSSPLPNDIFVEYIKRAIEEDIVLVASAGNATENTDCCPHYPSNFSEITDERSLISVASMDSYEDSRLSGFSNYGTQSVNIAALGRFVDGDEANALNGTSFAAPLVTAAAARILDDKPSMPNEEVVACILQTAVRVDCIEVQSEGRLNDQIECVPSRN